METENAVAIFCKSTKMNVKFCPHCEKIAQEKHENRSQADKIIEVLVDHEVHSTREIAEKTGLLVVKEDEDGNKEEKYPDIQRAIRLLRERGEPVECLDRRESIYKLLTPEEEISTNFWERTKPAKTKEVQDLESKVAQLQTQVSALKDENAFLTKYAEECDEENKRLKHGATNADSPCKAVA